MPISPAWVQAVSTIVLVILTGAYVVFTRKNVNVLTDQLEHERLRYHAQVLRQRVDDWLENLPRATDTDVEPPGVSRVGHPVTMEDVDDWEGWFWVTPSKLEDDPYFEDLINNHAPELKELKDKILRNFDPFWNLRKEFYDNYSDRKPLEELPFPADTREDYNLWAFEAAVLLERELFTKEELYESIAKAIEEDDQAVRSALKKPYPGGYISQEWTYILDCEVAEQDDHGDYYVPEEKDEKVAEALKQAINRLPEQEEYELTEQAADLLDQIEEDINQLENTLKELKGMEIYESNCEYVLTAD